MWWIALVGCTWITEAELDARLAKPASCGDGAEAWYDGVDQDCDGANDYDKDGDGHASAADPDPAGQLPSDDCWDDPDTVPAPYAAEDPADQLDAAAVHPGAPETWYDGFDQDCAGDHDFDQDADGFPRDLECDDLDPTRFPDASIPEVWYDGVDDDCDGNDGDQDGDGYYVVGYAFEIPAAYEAGDCWDDPAEAALWSPANGFPRFGPEAAWPGAADTWYDGLDQDCAGDDDFDQDVDGYRTQAYAGDGERPGDDCDDLVSSTHPGAPDAWYDDIDADCAGDDDFDQDGDGFRTGADCDDVDASVHPDATEACGNAVDEDCSGSTNDPDALDCTVFHADADGDGYGSDDEACLCEAEALHTAPVAGDCDDGDAAVSPGAIESCATAVDDDCDGTTNVVRAAGCVDWYVDNDGDTYGGAASQCQCEASGVFTASDDADCDDALASVHPGRAEVCNDVDDDCDGAADDGLPLYYGDADGDAFGAGPGDCATSGGVTNADDCDDTDDNVYPGAPELCDGVANDCDTSASWSSVEEDQLVAFVGTDGTWSDVSTEWNGASASTAISLSSGTYYVCSGTYMVKLVASSDTTSLVGLYGADQTTLDNNTTTGAVVSVTNGNVTLSGLTITGGHGGSGYGGGVIGNFTTSAITAPHVTLEDCVVTGNAAANGGGGVTAYNYGWVRLVRTTVEDNIATNGGGLYAATNADFTLEDSTIQGNTATGDAGGVFVDDGTLTMTSSWVIDNVSGDDAGGIFIDTGTASCTGGGIYGNEAADNGGGVYLSNYNSTTASFTATSCDFGTGVTDNAPEDVLVKTASGTTAADYTAYTSYGATASFVCSNLSDLCVP